MANNNKHTGPNVPALRFPEFSGEWEQHSLSDYLRFKNGLNPDAKRFGKGIKFISVMDILNNASISYDCVRASVAATEQEISDFEVEYGDVLFQRSSETLEDIGRSNIYVDSRHCVFGGFVIRGKMIGEYEPYFMKYRLDSPYARKSIIVKGAGAQHFNIGQDGLSKVELFFPKYEEQVKIGDLLRIIDDRINTQSKIIEELKTLRSALRYKLLHEMMVERMAKLGELCRITTGKLDANAMVEGGGYPFFTCAEQVYEIDQYAFDTEALLVSGNGANLGHIHYYCGKFNAYQRTYVLSDFSEDIQYLRQYLEAYLSKRIESEKNTGNTPYIVLGTLADMEIKLPKVPEQQRIAHDLSVLSQKIENETHMFELFVQEKKTLLGKMFI